MYDLPGYNCTIAGALYETPQAPLAVKLLCFDEKDIRGESKL